ncbi:Inner membrane protein YrbG, predicted calcium/sodium:proton antiporter [Pseudoalteromonas luteoviolacea B = ATCC 29581]|nr:Inner membrane protein YrbG, predicted calcium/sodium:proton antiporter [Pseudoalteromonas luteoviolacea B = ATCC 29581]
MDYLLLVLGLVLLISGADTLVKGAASLAERAGIPSLVIGLTIVAFGTSAPELAVSVSSAFAGQTEMAMANVVGSNIFNVLFILGAAALITPLIVSHELIKRDVPVMVGASALLLWFSRDGNLAFGESLVLFAGFVIYTTMLFVSSRNAAPLEGDTEIQTQQKLPEAIVYLIVGLGLLVFGANILVESAVNIARAFEISEAVIGLTILAIGTSLPEVVTSIMASIKGQRDIAVGNVVGSNIFNILAVLGISGAISPDGLSASGQLIHQDLPMMMFVALLCLPLFFTGALINRLEGGVFFSLYIVYTAYLLAVATQSPWLESINWVVWYLAAPTVALVVIGTLVQEKRARSKAQV